MNKAERAVLLVTLILIALLVGYTAGSGNSAGAGYFVKTERETDQTMALIGGDTIRTENADVSNTSASAGYVNTQKSASEPVNINSAGLEDLCELPGIGVVLAERIIAYRNENGLFASPDEIMNVYGIGAKTFESIKSVITV